MRVDVAAFVDARESKRVVEPDETELLVGLVERTTETLHGVARADDVLRSARAEIARDVSQTRVATFDPREHEVVQRFALYQKRTPDVAAVERRRGPIGENATLRRGARGSAAVGPHAAEPRPARPARIGSARAAAITAKLVFA